MSNVGKAALAQRWWFSLARGAGNDSSGDGEEEQETEGRTVSSVRRGNPGALARLRRADSAAESVLCPEAMELVVRLDSRHPDSQVRIARLASLLAHIRADNRQQRVAAALRGNDPDRPLMSAIRFRRLLLSESGEELFTGLRRAISMLDHRADVRDIAHTWLYWDHPELGEKVRIKWALTYAGGSIERNRLDATHVNQSGD